MQKAAKSVTITITPEQIGALCFTTQMFFMICEMIDVIPPAHVEPIMLMLLDNIVNELAREVQADGRGVADAALRDS